MQEGISDSMNSAEGAVNPSEPESIVIPSLNAHRHPILNNST